MPGITIADLNEAKQDVDHIADIATSPALTATDRLGNTKKTVAGWQAQVDGAVGAMQAQVDEALDTATGQVGAAAAAAAENAEATAADRAQTALDRSGAEEARDQAEAIVLGDFLQSGTGASVRTFSAKARDIVSVKDFGAVGDGTTDDTSAVHAAFNFAKGRRGTVYFPCGTYLVTSGYTQSTAYNDLRILGEGSTREGAGGSHIKLSNANAAVAFYTQNARHHLQVENITFSCAQAATDRAFFVFQAGGATHTFNNVNFESIERPIVYKTGCYFQSSTFTNVQFRDSGTIHSETSSLIGTLLVLDDVHHESAMPANTEKIVCNLQGIRQIQGRNFLLEGSGLDSTWTVLKLHNAFDADWNRFPVATFHGFWSEWNNDDPGYSVHQTGGRVVFQAPRGLISDIYKYKIDDRGAVEIRNATFSGTEFDIHAQFELEDYQCQVALYDTNARMLGGAKTAPNFTLMNVSEARNGTSPQLIGTNVSNLLSKVMWEFDGGFVDAGKLTLTLAASTTYYPSVDATYGRKMVIVPNIGTSQISAVLQVKTFAKTVAGQQWGFMYRMKLPTFSGGSIQVRFYDDSSNVALATTYDATYSGQEVEGLFYAADVNGGSSLLGFGIADVSLSGLSGNVELMYGSIFLGKAAPQTSLPSYPTNVITRSSAAPTTGEWKRGDIVWHTTPSASATPGWICTAAGTPGTWKAMANLAA